MNLRTIIASSLILVLAFPVCGGEKPGTLPVEFSRDVKPPGFLGTVNYTPTDTEKRFYSRLAEEQRVTTREPELDKSLNFSLGGHDGEFVSWYGIIRSITPGLKGGPSTLLLENKYSHELHDAHIQTVSINGAGDFLASASDLPKDLLPLELVRVYGTVKVDEKGTPVVRAEYIRVWRWFQFNFMEFGEDHSNPDWRKRITLNGDRVYSSRVSPEYYVQRLGPTNEEAARIKAFHTKPVPKRKSGK